MRGDPGRAERLALRAEDGKHPLPQWTAAPPRPRDVSPARFPSRTASPPRADAPGGLGTSQAQSPEQLRLEVRRCDAPGDRVFGTPFSAHVESGEFPIRGKLASDPLVSVSRSC